MPSGATVGTVRLDGHPTSYRVVRTPRGREVRVDGGRGVGTTRLVVSVR